MIIQEQVDLFPYNTFKIHAKAKYFTTVRSIEEFQQLIKSPIYNNEKHLLLGSGSNVLLNGDFEGLAIKVDIKGIDITAQDDRSVTLKVGAGEVWHSLVQYCVDKDWGGIENLSLIPGTMGAAPMQNIGAYGVEIKEVIKNVETLDVISGQVRNFSNQECGFGYRESVFKQGLKEKYFISSVTLSLTKKDHRFNTTYGSLKSHFNQGKVQLSVRAISDVVISIRQQKLPDPNVIGNAGSFFKNPTITHQRYQKIKEEYPEIPGYPIDDQQVKIPAGWLIEQCGWKGKRINNIGVHPQHALVLVNYGNGSGEHIWKLAMEILSSVKKKFDVQLQPEVNIIS